MSLNLIFLFLGALLQSACGVPISNQNPPVNNSAAVEPSASTTPDCVLQQQIEKIAEEAKGKVGVAATVIETGETVSLNANDRFAMQSVVKLPITLAIVKMVEDGKIALDQRIQITKDELVPSNMRSPIRDKHPNGAEITVRDLIVAALVESDGTASDVLQRVAGNADGVQAYINSIGIDEMKVARTHKEFAGKWELQYENWATPAAAIELLRWLESTRKAKAEHMQKSPGTSGVNALTGVQLIENLMFLSKPGANRLKGLLPAGTRVAHKTGTGGNRDGVTSATNDVGIITLPNGNHIAIAVFVGDSRADEKTREGVIAKVAKAVWDRWALPTSAP